MIHSISDYGTHVPMLTYALQATKDGVLELGVGFFSTPLITSLTQCQEPRYVLSADEDPDWLGAFHATVNNHHDLYWVRDWKDFLEKIKDVPFDIALIDCELPEKVTVSKYGIRKMLARELRSKVKILVVHDTECSWFRDDPDWRLFVESFAFAWEDKSTTPYTLSLSDSIDLKKNLIWERPSWQVLT